MKNILFVAPSSYPINGPESMVNAKHVYLLCKMGCKVDIVCRGINKRHIQYPSDHTNYLFHSVNSINEIQVDTRLNLRTLFRHIMTFLKTGFVYKGADWAYNAIKVCEQLVTNNNYDYIMTKDYPSEIVGLYIAKKYGIKWIPTWNDPYMIEKYPEPYGKGYKYRESFLRNRLIRAISKTPYCHLFPSNRLKDYMLLYMYGMPAEKCYIMPHILISKELEFLNDSVSDTFRIIHTGSVGKERNPENFLKAFREVIKLHPDWKITVTFLGIIDRAKKSFLYDLIDKYAINDYVYVLKPIPYNECQEFIKDFDLCLLIEAPCKEGIFLPSKVIDYLQNSKKILAVSPSCGVINDMNKKGIIDFFGEVNNVESIASAIESAYLQRYNHTELQKDIFAYGEKAVMELHNKILR